MESPTRTARSSRASTPSMSDGASPKIMSPRSRIQAMLAKIDSDSEDEVTSRTILSKAEPSHASALLLGRETNTSKSGHEGVQEDEGDDEDEDEDEVVVKPRGRMAARMAMGASALPFREEQNEGESPDEQEEKKQKEKERTRESVYQKIRRELLEEKTKQSDRREPDSRAEAQETTRETNTPSPPRRRPAPRARQLAQSPTASSRSPSPGLFMSPGPSPVAGRNRDAESGSESDADLPDSEGMQARLRELVERRRRERLAKEAEERDAEGERPQGNAPLSDLFDDDEDVDRVAEQKLTQQSRPTRKASKKALEEMNRETQRMSRNMQLTHLAKTKKKFTTADFLSAFTSKAHTATPLSNVTNVADSSSVAAVESDAEQAEARDTPPSSPPSVHDEQERLPSGVPRRDDAQLSEVQSDQDDLPDLEQLTSSQSRAKLDKGAAPVRAANSPSAFTERTSRKKSPRQYRILPPPEPTQESIAQDDSDSDIEIVQTDRVSSIFNSVGPSKSTGSRSLHLLRHLAHLNHTEKPRLKKGERPSMTPAQLEIELRRRAKIQAIKEREEKIANLKAKGIVIMTEEEREKEQVYIENMLERAREEADDLRKKERKAAKEAGLEETDVLASSDESEDGDYAASDEEGPGEVADGAEDIDLSGSEDEDEVEGEHDDMIDNEAHEGDGIPDEEQADGEMQDAGEEAFQIEHLPQALPVRRSRVKRVVDDDEDEDEELATTQKPFPTGTGEIVNNDLAAAFGFGPAPALGVSQMFAGTMADTQDSLNGTVPGPTFPDTEQDSFDMLRNLPSAPVPTFAPALDSQDTPDDATVEDSQTATASNQIDLHFSQLPQQETPLMKRVASTSQYGDLDFTPSQDVGVKKDYTPLRLDFHAPHTTQEIVMMNVPESPIAQHSHRRGRLVRRVAYDGASSDEEIDAASQDPQAADAFAKMRKAATKAQQVDFNKKASEARRMVEEQAEESEDEYAGLGGASDDDNPDNEEEDEADKAMIDESEVNVNERELAAFYAERARNQDEAQTSKLYKDLMSGAMRRKRGGAGNGAFDLDSDEDEQFAERRRRKQREEARKRRLLLQDESVGKLGTNDKKEAFLRAIEDREDELEDEEMGDLLDGGNEDEHNDNAPAGSGDSQSQENVESSASQQEPLTETSANVLKRKSAAAAGQASTTKRSKISMRRNPLEAFRAPRSLAEVRESVSFLIEDAHIDPEANGTVFSDDSDDGGEQQAYQRAPAAERRTKPTNEGVVDRLTLKKQTSSSLTMTDGNGSAVAFSTTGGSNGSFSKNLPGLLRRATTNNNKSSMPPPALPASRSVTREDSAGVRMGGSRKSSINYQAREAERRIVLERAERKRKESVRKIAGMRTGSGSGTGSGGAASGLGGLFVRSDSGFE